MIDHLGKKLLMSLFKDFLELDERETVWFETW